MKERLVRGTYLVDVVRLIQAHKEDRPFPEFGTWEQDLLRKRVSPSTWYSLSVFDSLLQIVHRYVYDGSEVAAQSMGRFAARSALEQIPDRLLVAGNPLASLNKMNERWRQLFNFGEVSVTSLEDQEHGHRARIQVSGYPDMSACQGHVIMGWSMEMTERAGGKEPKVRLEERPWMHNTLLTYTIEWN